MTKKKNAHATYTRVFAQIWKIPFPFPLASLIQWKIHMEFVHEFRYVIIDQLYDKFSISKPIKFINITKTWYSLLQRCRTFDKKRKKKGKFPKFPIFQICANTLMLRWDSSVKRTFFFYCCFLSRRYIYRLGCFDSLK